jgi:hypothetical protein
MRLSRTADTAAAERFTKNLALSCSPADGAAMRSFTLEQVTAIRRDYADGMPIEEIKANHNASQDGVYYWVDGGRRSGPLSFPPLPRRRGGTPRIGTRGRLSGDRESLIRRMWRTAEAQVREIETRLLGCGQAPDERERDARVLAVLARTLRELATVDGDARKAKPGRRGTNDNDAAPGNLDDLRRELSQRLGQLVAEAKTVSAE